MSDPLKNIIETTFGVRSTYVIPPACHERFLLMNHPLIEKLRARGLAAAGLSRLAAGYCITHPCAVDHLVLFSLEGQGEVQTLDGVQRISPGHVCLLLSGQPHRLKIVGRRWRMVWFHALGDWGECIARQGAHLRLDPLGPSMWNTLEALLQEMAALEQNGPAAASRYVDLLEIYLDRALREPIHPAQSQVAFELQHLWAHVSANLEQPWDVRALARHLHLSPSHFARQVLAHTGLAPMHYLKKLRMEQARQLLLYYDYPLEWIATMVGYHNPFSFSTAFRRHFGLSPRAYRQRTLATQKEVPAG